ncbi:MAG: exopolysaccharide Pel transporter PelG [Blautia wexlerae]
MAGIGFELKKLFSRRGLFASFRAYGYAGIICTVSHAAGDRPSAGCYVFV